MRVDEAKSLVLDLIVRDLAAVPMHPILIDPRSPDPGDPNKFMLDGKVARPIHYYDGWFVPIDLGWFSGGYGEPRIHDHPFHWYVFAIPRRMRYRQDHYLICDYLQMREWVLDFAAPLGRDHRDHKNWRADLRLYTDDGNEAEGYFRWGDEPVQEATRPERVFEIDNVTTLHDVPLTRPVGRVGVRAAGGESAAHRRLKLYVAAHPTAFGMSGRAQSKVEYLFQTGDRVDVMFENHAPDRTVVEVEVEGEHNICVGIHQAIKYRSLAEADAGYTLASGRVRSLVVAYDTRYPSAERLAARYNVTLHAVDRDLVLATAI